MSSERERERESRIPTKMQAMMSSEIEREREDVKRVSSGDWITQRRELCMP